MNLWEEFQAKRKAEEDFERKHGYSMPRTMTALDGQSVNAYTFSRGTISVEVGCSKDDGHNDHSCPLVIRMWNIGGGGQGEAKVTFGGSGYDNETRFEMSTFGGWEYYEMVNAVKFILDVLENGKPMNDYSLPIQ